MTRRFTETEKWNDKWFRRLPLAAKVLLEFLRDRCDVAGFWQIDMEAASFYTGLPETENATLGQHSGDSCAGALEVLMRASEGSEIAEVTVNEDRTCLYLTNFLLQQGNWPLTGTSNVILGIRRAFVSHKSFGQQVLQILRESTQGTPKEDFTNSSGTLKEELVNSPGKGKGKGKGNGNGKEGGVGETKTTTDDVLDKMFAEVANVEPVSGSCAEVVAISPQPAVARYTDEAVRLADLLLTLIRERKPDFQRKGDWAKDLDLMIRRDNRSPPDIEAVIRWCQADCVPRGSGDFCWANNILSGGALRRQYDRLDLQRKQEAQRGTGRAKDGTPQRSEARRSFAEPGRTYEGVTIVNS